VALSPLFRILASLVVVDAVFSVLIAYVFLLMMGIDGSGTTPALIVYAVLWVVKIVGWVSFSALRLRPLSQWLAGDKPPEDKETIIEVANAAYRVPFTVGGAYSIGLFLFYIIYTLLIYVAWAGSVPLGPGSIMASVLAASGLTFGATVMTFSFSEWLIAPVIEKVSLAAQERGIAIRGRGLTFRTRLVAFALTLALAPTLYLSSITYMSDARAEHRDLVRRAELAVAEVALGHEAAARAAGALVFVFDATATVSGGDAERELAARPRLARLFERAVAAAPTGSVHHPREGVIAFRTEGDRRLGVVFPQARSVSFGTMLVILVFLLIVSLWAPFSALMLGNATAVPVVRVSNALARVGRGEVTEAPKVPVFHQDEVGSLSRNYNVMLDQLRMLAQRATEVSKGALDVEFDLRGDLGDAFRGQVISLRDIVGHIAQSAQQLASAASEMYAAAQEQEAAAQQQSSGVEEVSRTMESLLAAATHVTESTMGVLGRAERTRETTARTTERISELSAHASRIGEILETIREIADRSDLLALNASLEGTRAGEAGRGFALVAGEMRKLAERVTASVTDIKKLVADVRASVSATVIANEESSTLAEGTTESARQINLVTQQQRSGTEQAGQSMRDVASMITQSLAATQQIRSLAEDLKVQADNLTGLVSRFRLPTRRSEVNA
jgi:methyl-accepting chemotaxis protein